VANGYMITTAGSRIKFFALPVLLLLCIPLQAQKTKPNQEPSDKSRFTFKLPVDVITVNAVVTDQKGKAVTDLTQSDFQIYEDGKPQSIQTFALESFKPVHLRNQTPEKTADTAAIKEASNPTRPRMISIFIDDSTTTSIDYFPRLVKALEKYVQQDLGPWDQAAILSSSGRVNYAFSSDKQLLLEEINTLLNKLHITGIALSDCPKLSDSQAQSIAQWGEVGGDVIQEVIACAKLDAMTDRKAAIQIAKSIALAAARSQNQQAMYRSRTLLLALRQHFRSLKHFQAKKELILFSTGFLSDDLKFELQDVVDQALHSGIIINTAGIRGLFNPYFMPAGQKNISSSQQVAYKDDSLEKETPLGQLAYETGGIFFHNNNDMYNGLQEITNRESIYYVMTYSVSPRKADAEYHHIKLEVSRPGLTLAYRNGYYTPKEELTFERRKKEDILEGLRAPGNLNEIPIELGYNYYQEDDTHYDVSFVANVNIRGVRFLDEDSRHRNLFNVVVAVFDEENHLVDGKEKSIDFKLTDSSYENLLGKGLSASVELRLTPGHYKIKAVVREGVQGKMGSLTKAIEIP
jgi:VWFA-related protein